MTKIGLCRPQRGRLFGSLTDGLLQRGLGIENLEIP